MKLQLLEKFKTLLEIDDLAATKQEIKDIRTAFKNAVATDQVIQKEAWDGLEKIEGEDFEYLPSEDDKIFNELFKTYEERIKLFDKKIAEEKTNNLTQKKELLAQLEEFVHNEDNIGKSFQNFNLLNEKWKNIGDVPKDQYQKISNQYQRLRESFFYNITIYKELQGYDLKINLKRKEELILRAKALEEKNSIKECEYMVKQIQKEWSETGPSPKETYKEIGDKFYSIVRAIYTKIQKHYDDFTTEMKINLAQKNDLLIDANKLIEKEITNHTEWIKKTNTLIALQEKWKTIGYTKNKEHDDVWLSFRKVCDLFFEEKKQFYALRNEEYSSNKKKKTELIEKVNQVKENTDWEKTTEYLLSVQNEWKAIGVTFQKDEQRLWHSFKASCDIFFIRKKESFKNQAIEQKKNLTAKIELIEDIKMHELSEDITENIKFLKKFSELWQSIGSIPEKNVLKTNSAYNDILNRKFGNYLTEEGEKDSPISYEQKIEIIKNSPNRDLLVRKEAGALRKKMDKLRQEVNQYENNMGFFSNSKGSETLKTAVKKKVNAVETEIEEIEKRLQLLN